MPNRPKRPSAALYMLRSITANISRIVERHANIDVRVSVPGVRLEATNGRFAAVYDRVLGFKKDSAVAKLRHTSAIDELLSSAANWAVVFEEDLKTHAQHFKPARRTPDDILNAAERLAEALNHTHEQSPIDGAPEALTHLQGQIDEARGALQAMKNGLAAEQSARNECRLLGVELSSRLVAYRRALARVIGRNHIDYRALDLYGKSGKAKARAEKRSDSDSDSDNSAEQEPGPPSRADSTLN